MPIAMLRSSEHTSWVATVDDRPVGFVAIHYADEDAARAGEWPSIRGASGRASARRSWSTRWRRSGAFESSPAATDAP